MNVIKFHEDGVVFLAHFFPTKFEVLGKHKGKLLVIKFGGDELFVIKCKCHEFRLTYANFMHFKIFSNEEVVPSYVKTNISVYMTFCLW